MGSDELMDDGRRRLMKAVASAGDAVGVGATVTAIVPFVASIIYFAFFFLMPIYSRLDKPKVDPTDGTR